MPKTINFEMLVLRAPWTDSFRKKTGHTYSWRFFHSVFFIDIADVDLCQKTSHTATGDLENPRFPIDGSVTSWHRNHSQNTLLPRLGCSFLPLLQRNGHLCRLQCPHQPAEGNLIRDKIFPSDFRYPRSRSRHLRLVTSTLVPGRHFKLTLEITKTIMRSDPRHQNTASCGPTTMPEDQWKSAVCGRVTGFLTEIHVSNVEKKYRVKKIVKSRYAQFFS